MTSTVDILFLLLRSALWGEELHYEDFAALDDAQWGAVYRLSSAQGVLALAYDGLQALPGELQPSRALKIQWAYNVDRVEKRYAQQKVLAGELADVYRQHGIDTLLLKGLGLSLYYPKPNHRPFGDLDCYLYGAYEKGNVVAEEAGATVKRDFYKHSHISYKGLIVENHQFCVAIRGSRRVKELEVELEAAVQDRAAAARFADTQLILPTPYFNALFLTKHAFGHFLSEGINVRHICDWALFLRAEQDNIDIERFYAACDCYGFRRFVDVVTAIATQHLALRLTNRAITTQSPYTERMLDDILYNREHVFNSDKGVWARRMMLVGNVFRNRWRYRDIARRSVWLDMARTALSFLFERNPKLPTVK